MILSLKTPKQRVTAPNGTIYYAEQYSTLHAETAAGEEAMALNLEHNNWAVSARSELAFVTQGTDGATPQLIIADPVAHTALAQRLEGHSLLNVLLLEREFVANIPGYLVVGKRREDGALLWKGMRSVDFGAGFRFRVEGRQLLYTKRGCCDTCTYDLDSRTRARRYDPELLWAALFGGAFQSSFVPPFDPEAAQTLAGLKRSLTGAAAEHAFTAKGIAVFAIFSLLAERGVTRGEDLAAAVELDFREQYMNELDERFPARRTVDALFRADASDPLPVQRPIQSRQHRWCLHHEPLAGLGKRARLIRPDQYRISLVL